MRPLPLAVTMGEPAGIGGEITLKAWALRGARALGPFFVLDDPARLERLAREIGLDVPVRPIAAPDQAEDAFAHGLPVLPIELAEPPVSGRPSQANAGAVLSSIDMAVGFAQHGLCGGVVTNPIQKAVLYAAGFRHPGHTEYLAALAGLTAPPVMMLAIPDLRVVPVTIHLPLRDVVANLTVEAIVHAGRVTVQALRRDFGVTSPRLAVAGVNPHAGEGGTIGREEIEIVGPAIDILRREGLDILGPAPADTLFHATARLRYDAALCMYHDQALIPLKTLDFDQGVNVTLGLPFVRTSPDHGTALDIAGTGRANPDSLVAAIRLAGEIAARRHAHA